MTCPSIDELLAGQGGDHATGCAECRAVLDLVEARSVAGCGRAEALLAARAAGRIAPDSARLLALHLDGCASCALVAGSLDAPEIADTLASAAELDRSLDALRVPDAGPRTEAPGRDRRRHRLVLAAIALVAVAAAAAVVTRALG